MAKKHVPRGCVVAGKCLFCNRLHDLNGDTFIAIHGNVTLGGTKLMYADNTDDDNCVDGSFLFCRNATCLSNFFFGMVPFRIHDEGVLLLDREDEELGPCKQALVVRIQNYLKEKKEADGESSTRTDEKSGIDSTGEVGSSSSETGGGNEGEPEPPGDDGEGEAPSTP